MAEPQILVFGSHAPGLLIHVRRIPRAGETVMGWGYQEPVDGGKGSNQAIAAARLGGQVSFVGCLGRDRIGQDAELWLRREGVDLSFVRISESGPSGVGFILLDEKGVPAMVTSPGSNSELARADIDQALDGLPEAKVFLTQFEIDPSLALYAAGQAKARGLVSIVNPAPAAQVSPAGLSRADILIPNESEAKTLLGIDLDVEVSLATLAERLRQQCGVACVMVTGGALGVAVADAHEVLTYPAPAVPVVDTSGAGDAFCAAVAVALVNGLTQREAAHWACQVASLSVTQPGTIPAYPTRAEVEAFLSRDV